MKNGSVHFFKRTFPSANMVLIHGHQPVLFDSGFGTDSTETLQLLASAGTPAESLGLVLNSHYHSDHVGGNHRLQSLGIPVAAHAWEAAMVNRRNPEACTADWLDQPIQPYRIDRPLIDGDVIETGGATVEVIHTPGHTLGHISLWLQESRILLAGDAFHGDDVAWLNPFREGAGTLERAIESLDRLARLNPLLSYSGHSDACAVPLQAIDSARRRYEKWAGDPDKMAWHACKRILAYALMIKGGLPEAEVRPYILGCAWFQDYCRYVFGAQPEAFVDEVLAEVVRSGAAEWQAGCLCARSPHTPPAAPLSGPLRPREWASLN